MKTHVQNGSKFRKIILGLLTELGVVTAFVFLGFLISLLMAR